MPRAFASAQISFGLVSIPVRLFTATESSEKVSFNMLHKECGSRIQQQLYCPKDERTIERTETVKGYEFSKGQYVLFTTDELKALADFYGSPVGKSAMKKFGAYMADIMPVVQAEIMKAAAKMNH